MLDEIGNSLTRIKRTWITAPMEISFGRGINLEIKTTKIEQLYNRCQQLEANIFLPIEDKWYRAGNMEIGNRQFIVLDPDGYMLRTRSWRTKNKFLVFCKRLFFCEVTFH